MNTDTLNGGEEAEDTEQEYPYEGTFVGTDGKAGYVETDDGRQAYLSMVRDVPVSEYRYGRRVAFDIERPFDEKTRSPRVSDFEFLGRDYDYDEIAEVVYRHGNKIFLEVEQEEDVQVYTSVLWGGEDATAGDKVAIDWAVDGDRVRRGEVR